jgi:hypothetical protein
MGEGPATLARKQSPKSTSVNPPAEPKDALRRVAIVPSNKVTLLAQGLAATMKKQTDLKYNLVWAFGGYLALVPQRLGVNEALDTAVDALVTAHASFASRKEVSVSALTKYSMALGALRKCLNNPRTAGSSETLCAVMVLLSVQVSRLDLSGKASLTVLAYSRSFGVKMDRPCGGSSQDSQGSKELRPSRHFRAHTTTKFARSSGKDRSSDTPYQY